jgi:hypothetical protein
MKDNQDPDYSRGHWDRKTIINKGKGGEGEREKETKTQGFIMGKMAENLLHTKYKSMTRPFRKNKSE